MFLYQLMLPVNQREGIRELILITESENRGGRYLLQLQKIFRKNIPAAFLLYKNRYTHIPGNPENGKELFFNIGPDVF